MTEPVRVLLTSQAVAGHLNPNLAVASALMARGHEVAVYSGRAARGAIERTGARFYSFEPAMDGLLHDTILPDSGQSSAARTSTDHRTFLNARELNAALKRWLLETVPQQYDDLRSILPSFLPDVIVSDLTLLGPILLRDLLPVPVGIFSVLAACSVPGRDAPPWGRGLPAPRSLATRARASVERRVIDWLLTDLRDAASTLRTKYGLPPLEGRLADEYGRVPLFMVSTAPEFDYTRGDLPSTVEYVGACTVDAQPDAAASLPWIDELPAGTPVVHVTEGTIHTTRPLVLQAAAIGLANLPMHVVMTTGRHRKPDELELGPPAPNIRIEQFVPHQALFPRTDCVVTTGGAGTVNAALLAGVPLVVVPTGWDLPENAQRVVECGAGLRIDARRCTPARLRDAVETVLADPRYRDNARRIGAALVRQGGARRAAELIEALAATRPAAALMTTPGRRV